MSAAYTSAVTPYDAAAVRAPAATLSQAMLGAESSADNVVYTVQNTSTERCLQESEFGGVLTIVTTTVTRTITERVLDSEDEDSDDDVHAGEGSFLDGLHPVSAGQRRADSEKGEWTHRDQRTFYRR